MLPSRRLMLAPMAALALLPAAASAAPLDADLDPAYASGAGAAFADFAGDLDAGVAAAPGPGGSALVGATGGYSSEQPPYIAAARFTEAGILDTAYSGDGRAQGPEGMTADAGSDAAGRLVAAGWINHESGHAPFAFVRFDAAGVHDKTLVARPLDAPTASANGVLVDPDGSAIAVGGGYAGAFDGHALVMARMTSGGERDLAFGAGGGDPGIVIADPVADGQETGLDALRQPSGAPAGTFVVASRLERGDMEITVLSRHQADGSLDKTFGGGDGVVETAVDGTAFAAGPDGSLVVASGGSDRVYMERRAADGSLLKEWHADLGDQLAVATGAAVQADGRILVAGTYGKDSFLVRFTAGGAEEARIDVSPAAPRLAAADLLLTAKGPVLAGTADDAGGKRRIRV